MSAALFARYCWSPGRCPVKWAKLVKESGAKLE
jgi:hypothetical protein